MSDLAFLLLIFFVVTTTFAVADEGISLLLPGRAKSVTRVMTRDLLELAVRADGSVTADGRPIRLSDVRALVARRMSGNEALVVVVATERDARYGVMVSLLDEVKLANCRRVSLKTLG
jgi:biopolymer transport protein ExbD